MADAKICGHYVNSIIGDLQLKGSDFHEILFLDTNGDLAEGAAQNLFFVKVNLNKKIAPNGQQDLTISLFF